MKPKYVIAVVSAAGIATMGGGATAFAATSPAPATKPAGTAVTVTAVKGKPVSWVPAVGKPVTGTVKIAVGDAGQVTEGGTTK